MPILAQPPATGNATVTNRAEVYVLAFVYPALKDGAILCDSAGIVSKEIMGIPKSWFKPTNIINSDHPPDLCHPRSIPFRGKQNKPLIPKHVKKYYETHIWMAERINFPSNFV